MRNLLALILATLVTACAVNPDLAMKLQRSPSDFKILMGEFNGSLALIHGDPTNASIHATDGEISCDGTSNSGRFKTDMMTKNIVTHLFKVTCSNGAEGQVILKITMKGDRHVFWSRRRQYE